MRQGKTISKLRKYAVLSIVICLGVLVLINIGAFWLENEAGLKADMTDNKLYSLSQDTKKEIDGLDGAVEIYSVSMPYGENSMLSTLLEAYASASDKISLHHVNSSFSERLQEKLGLSGAQAKGNYVVVTNGDKSRQRVIYEDEMFVKDENGNNVAMKAEMKITSAMKYADTGEMQKIKLLTGHMEMPATQLTELLNLLDNTNAQVELCQLSDEDETLDPKNDIIMVIAPKADLEQEEYEKLSEFLDQGGSAVFMMSRAEMDQATGAMKIYLAEMTRFNEIFKKYGIQVNQDIIMSSDLNAVSLDASTISMVMSNHPICGGIDKNVVLSQCGSLSVDGAEVIVSTSEQSYAKQLSEDITTLKKEDGDRDGPFGVAAVGKNKDSTIVVFTSASLVKDEVLAIEGNQSLVRNTVDYVWQREDNLNIGTKSLAAAEGMEVQRTIVAAVSIAFIPMFIVAIGIWAIAGRNKKRR